MSPVPGRGRSAPLVARLGSAGYLRKWFVLGALIGIVAGAGAVVFFTALQWATHLLLGVAAGYAPPSPFGEGNATGSAHFVRPWAIPLVVGLGGLLSGLIVFTLAPEAEGHGTDAAISAVHHNPRGVRARVSAVKIAASAIMIGAGGSGGREGPTAQISAGFGSMLARWLDLSPTDARIAVSVGVGSGIGSIFRTPLGGAVLGAEILYRDDIEAEALLPSLVASLVGFTIFGAVEGFSPIFGYLRGYHFRHPLELVYYGAIGLVAGLIGRLYSFSFHGAIKLTRRLPGARAVKPAVAGLMVGLLGLALPGVLGTGYGWVQRAMGASLLGLPLWVVLALPFAKILATSLSIGSGGSGGIFGPGMVIGAFVGAAAWRLLQHLPAVPHDPAPFVIVGMIACFGSIAHAPLAVLLMVVEMTGSLELLAPGMVAVALAVLVVGDRTIYTSQLRDRAESMVHRFRFGLPLLATIRVADALRSAPLVLSDDVSGGAAVARLVAARLSGAPVVDQRGRFRGAVDADVLRGRAPDVPTRAATDPLVPTVCAGAMLDEAVAALTQNERSWVAVLDEGRRVAGVVTMADVVRAYRAALESSLRRLGQVFGGAAAIAGRIDATSPLAGTAIGGAGLPLGAVVVTVQRGEHLIIPDDDTLLEPGDAVSVLAPRIHEAEVRAMLARPEGDTAFGASGGDDDGPGMV